jgi:glycosyltransferase involved in cell wall biosynthesis
VARLKVLHVITTLPRLSGAADNTRYTVNLLDPARYDIHLACGMSELDASRVEAHVKMIALESLIRPVAPISDLRTAWALHRLLRRERYDIVHTHLSKAGVLGRLAARLAGVPVIVHTAHTISFAASTSPLANWFFQVADRVCAMFSAKIITVSQVNTATYLDHGVGQPAQYVTIHSGVETAKYLDRSERAACRAEFGIRDEDLLIVWIGRLNRQKDPVTFVRAARSIADRLPQARFVMVGEDPLGESLEEQVRIAIRNSAMESSLRLLGYRPDVHRILAAADLVMHTSLYEGLARSVVEAMLAGVPIVATAVDGVLEAVVPGERGGLLAPPSDPVRLADAALELLQDPVVAARVGAAGQAWAKERFEVKDMVKAIDDLYQRLWDDFTRR